MNSSQCDHPNVDQAFPDSDMLFAFHAGLFFSHNGRQPAAFVGRQPGRAFRPVGQEEPDAEPQHDRGNGLAKEQPFPARQAPDTIHAEQGGGRRGAQADGDWNGRHETGDHPGAVIGWEPICEVQDHAGEKAGLGQAQKKAQREEADRPFDERETAGDDTPADHDPGDPFPGTNSFQNQVRRHLQQEVSPEKRTGAEAIDI